MPRSAAVSSADSNSGISALEGSLIGVSTCFIARFVDRFQNHDGTASIPPVAHGVSVTCQQELSCFVCVWRHVRCLPAHSCVLMNLHQGYHWHADSQRSPSWLP